MYNILTKCNQKKKKIGILFENQEILHNFAHKSFTNTK